MRSKSGWMVVLGMAALFAVPVLAGFTAVMAPPGGEFTHKQIFECAYGGTFTASGINFITGGGSGTITATRVDDTVIGGMLNLLTGAPGSAEDDIWTDGIATCTAEARFAGNSQEFGYRVTSSSYVKLFDVTSSSSSTCNVGGSATVTFGTGATWEWARANDSDSGLSNPHYSDEASNGDGLDHMVTYAITGIPSVPTTTKVWAVFFEDVSGGGSDRDFNDIMVEIRAVECVANSDCDNDGLFCNGNEVCKGNVCVHAGDPCTPPKDLCCEDNNTCKAQCCSNADCPSDGNFCNGVEACVNGVCVSPGSPCSGGTPVCCGTFCVTECCSNADCQAPNPPCEGGELCISGVCVTQPDAGVTTACENDSPANLCRIDHCNGAGQCVFDANVVCQSPSPPCEGGEYCDTADGLCKDNPDAGVGTTCEADKNKCTIDECDGFGNCERVDVVTCADPVGDCEAGQHCVTSTGLCVDDNDPPSGTTCDTDFNACTVEQCDGFGVCVPMGTVTCQAPVPPCEGGEYCDTVTGFCVANPDAVYSTECEVESPANKCTIDHCNGLGQCVILGNVTCQSPEPPCEGGQFCDTASGLCVNNPDPPLSTLCELQTPANLCIRDHCNGTGQCVFHFNVTCQAPNPPCEAGQHCVPASGLCVDDPDALADTPCELEVPPDYCTVDECDGAGLCVHVSDVTCTPANPPCEGGANCNPATGTCVNKPDAILSTFCELDSPPDLCKEDHCNGKGLCVYFRDVFCPGPVPPCEAGEMCNPTTGDCDTLTDPSIGTPCTTDSDVCTNEHCDGSGLCVVFGDKCGACCDHSPLGGICTEDVLPADCTGDQMNFYLNESCVDVEARGDCEEHTGACCDEDPFGGCQVLPGSQCDCDKCVFHKDMTCEEITCIHNAIPTVSQWGLVVLTLLLLTGAKIYFGRREAEVV